MRLKKEHVRKCEVQKKTCEVEKKEKNEVEIKTEPLRLKKRHLRLKKRHEVEKKTREVEKKPGPIEKTDATKLFGKNYLRHQPHPQETYLREGAFRKHTSWIPVGSHLSWALILSEADQHSSRESWISFQFRLLHHLFTLFVLMGLDDFFPEILNKDFQQKEKRSKRSEKCHSCEYKQFQPKIVG